MTNYAIAQILAVVAGVAAGVGLGTQLVKKTDWREIPIPLFTTLLFLSGVLFFLA
jgi:predicted membrane protein